MNHDDFEQKLKRQPLRQVPTEWRQEILSAAKLAVATRHPSHVTQLSWLSTFNRQLFALLWPNPQAWAGLAAVWILIFALDFSIHDTSPVSVKKSSPPSPEVIVELRQQQLLLVELIGSRETHVTGPSKTFDHQPRSERRFETLMT
jgi:hypothetical protein